MMATSLNDLQQARDNLVDRLIATGVDSDVDKIILPLIDRVDDFTAAFDAENNIATE